MDAGLELNSQSVETIEVSDADRMAILEGMQVAKQEGDDIRVSILIIIRFILLVIVGPLLTEVGIDCSTMLEFSWRRSPGPTNKPLSVGV